MTEEDLPYRPCVGIILVNDRGEVFVGQRIDTTEEAWQMPQGGIDEEEDPIDAAYRELREEIGTDNAVVVAESERWLTYELPDELLGQIWGGAYRGQKQKWFVMRFEGHDGEIDIATGDPEFNDWKWLPFHRLPEVIISFKRPVYESLIEEFRDLIAGIGVDSPAEARAEQESRK